MREFVVVVIYSYTNLEKLVDFDTLEEVKAYVKEVFEREYSIELKMHESDLDKEKTYCQDYQAEIIRKSGRFVKVLTYKKWS